MRRRGDRRRYKVIGPTDVLGHAPGSTFLAAVGEPGGPRDAKHEQRLIASGHLITIVTRSAPPARPAGATLPRQRNRPTPANDNSDGGVQ